MSGRELSRRALLGVGVKDAAWWTVLILVLSFILLALIATQLSLTTHAKPPKANHYGFWAMVLIVLLLLAAVIAIGLASEKGRFDGILIDRYNRITLANFQILLWTLLVVSALAATLMTNLMSGKNNLDVLDIAVPPELWLAMGISGGTYAGSKVIKLKIPDTTIERKCSSDDARWIDMLTSDVGAGDSSIDISKVQMLFFTMILVAGYAATVANSLINATGSINELPKLNNTFITLLLISNGTYLVRKSAHLIPNVKTTGDAKKNDTKDKPETG